MRMRAEESLREFLGRVILGGGRFVMGFFKGR